MWQTAPWIDKNLKHFSSELSALTTRGNYDKCTLHTIKSCTRGADKYLSLFNIMWYKQGNRGGIVTWQLWAPRGISLSHLQVFSFSYVNWQCDQRAIWSYLFSQPTGIFRCFWPKLKWWGIQGECELTSIYLVVAGQGGRAERHCVHHG